MMPPRFTKALPPLVGSEHYVSEAEWVQHPGGSVIPNDPNGVAVLTVLTTTRLFASIL